MQPVGSRGRGAVDDDRGTVVGRATEVRLHAVAVLRGDERPHHRRVVVAGADDDVGDARRDRVDQRVGDGADRDDDRDRHAALARRAVGRPRWRRRRRRRGRRRAARPCGSSRRRAPGPACRAWCRSRRRGARSRCCRRTTPRRRRDASSSAFTASASPCTTVCTPSGNPASRTSSASSSDADGSFSDGFVHERVAARQRVGQHPQRDHHREVERCDADDDADRLEHRVHVDARRHLGAVRTLEEVRDTARELDAVEAAGDLTLRVVEHLAVLRGDERGQLVAVRVDQLAQPEHRRGAAARAASPATRRGVHGRHLHRRASTSAADANATSAVCTPRAGSNTGRGATPTRRRRRPPIQCPMVFTSCVRRSGVVQRR